jgi:mRNA-degrading endonuclease RelE of RelBE toxin-antitoxin system
MKVEYSKAFVKAVKKLSGKMLDSVKKNILEVKKAENIGNL